MNYTSGECLRIKNVPEVDNVEDWIFEHEDELGFSLENGCYMVTGNEEVVDYDFHNNEKLLILCAIQTHIKKLYADADKYKEMGNIEAQKDCMNEIKKYQNIKL